MARRVGLKCEPISYPAHFLLRFREGQGEDFTDSYYVDVFNNGNVIRRGSCPHSCNYTENQDSQIVPASARQVCMLFQNKFYFFCKSSLEQN